MAKKKDDKNKKLMGAAVTRAKNSAPRTNTLGVTQADVDATIQRRLQSSSNRQNTAPAASTGVGRLGAVTKYASQRRATGTSTYFDEEKSASERLNERGNRSLLGYDIDGDIGSRRRNTDTSIRDKSKTGAGTRRSYISQDGSHGYYYEKNRGDNPVQTAFNASAVPSRVGNQFPQNPSSYRVSKNNPNATVDPDMSIEAKRVADVALNPSQFMTQESDSTMKYDDGKRTEYYEIVGQGDNAHLVSVPEERYYQRVRLDGGINPSTVTNADLLKASAAYGWNKAVHGLKSAAGTIGITTNRQEQAYNYMNRADGGNNLNRHRNMLEGSYAAGAAAKSGDERKARTYINQEAFDDMLAEQEQLKKQQELDQLYQAYQAGVSAPMKLVMDVTDTTAAMVPGMISNFFVPGSFIPEMAVQAYGSSYNNARLNGATRDEAVLSGIQNAAVESLSEMMFPGAKAFSKMTGVRGFFNPGKDVQNAALGFIKTTAGKDVVTAFKKLGIAGAEEGAEELVAGLVEPLLDNMIYAGEDINGEWWHETVHDALYNALVGFASGGGFGAVDVIGGTINGADIRANADVANLINQGLAMPEDSKTFMLAKRLDVQNKAGEGLGNLDVTDLTRAMNEDMKAVQEDHRKQIEFADRAIAEDGNGSTQPHAEFDYAENRNTRAAERFGSLYDDAIKKIQGKISKALPEDATAEEIEAADNETRNQAERAAAPIARIISGEGTANDTAAILGNSAARETFEEMTGKTLADSNKEAIKQLNEINATNRIMYAKEQAQSDIESVADAVFGTDEITKGKLVNVLVQTDSRDIYAVGRAAQEAFIAGRSGQNVTQTAFSGFITPEQFRQFYEAGKAAEELYEQSRVDLLKKKAEENKARKKSGSKEKPTVTVSEKAKAGKKAPSRQMMQFFDRVAKKYGVNIEIVDGSEISGSNGEFVGNTIRLSADTGKFGRGFIPVFSHEFTHFLEDMAPEAYRKLYEFVLSKSNLQDGSDAFRNMVNEKIALYRSHGKRITVEGAQRECIADMAQTVFTEENLAEFIDLEPSVAKDVINAVLKIIDDFIAMLKEGRFYNPETEWIRSTGEYDEYRKMWMDAAKLAARRSEQGVEVRETSGHVLLKGYDSKQFERWGNSNSIVVYSDDAQLDSFINRYKTNSSNEFKRLYFGMVPDAIAKRVMNDFGIDIQDYHVTLSSTEVTKVFKDHGNEKIENNRGQRAMELEDFRDIPRIISDPDEIVLSGDYNGKPVLQFKKMIDGKDTVVTYTSTGKHMLIVQTMYGGKKRSLAAATGKQVPINTPKATNSTAPKSNIAFTSNPGNTNTQKEQSRSQLATDAEYLELAKDPEKNKRKLKKMVENAIIEKGEKNYFGDRYKTVNGRDVLEPRVLWHYSRTVNDYGEKAFTQFNAPAFFSKNRDYATNMFYYGYKQAEAKPFYLLRDGDNIFHMPNAYGNRYFKGTYFTERYDFLKGVVDENAEYNVDDFVENENIVNALRSNGYDIIYDRENGYDCFVALNKNMIKSADPVTYDDNGNVIPLSERFNPENEDIRYQLTEDSKGRTLSAGQMEYFKDSKVVDENGRLKVMYHGTPQGGFTVFKNGLQFFTESKDYADTYQSPSATSRTAGKTASNPQTYSVYLNIKKPFDIRDAETRRIFVDEYVKGGWALGINPYEEYKDQTTSGLPSWEEADNIYEFLEENDMLDQYDGIIIDEGGIPGQNGETISRGIAYVTFYPEQAKDITNENPTSDPDIRFQLNAPVEQVRDLIAVHNLREKELLGSIQLGGFPMPSIAVTKADMGHDNYGDITLMFHSDTIDPQRSSDNQVYGGDAWTPTFPQIDKKISEKAADRVRDRLLNVFGVNSPTEFQSFAKGLRFPSLDPDNLLDKLRSADSPYQAFKDDIVFRYAYLMENGTAFPFPIEESKLYGEDEAFWMNLSKEIPNALEAKNGDVMPYEPIIRKVIKDAHAGGRLSDSKLPAHLREKLISMYDKELPFGKVDSYLYNLVQYQRSGMPSILDESATRERLNELVDAAGYEAWVNSLFDGIIEKEGIRNEKDLFTPSGNRRSWEALHDEINLNNIVKSMRQGMQKGAGIFGASDPIGAATREYRSIDEIREDSDRLRTISEEEYQAIKDELIDRFHDIAERFSGNKKGFGVILDTGSVIIEDIANSKTKESLKRHLQQEEQYGYMYSDLLLDDLWELISDMRSMPTGYFEAKPRRAVGFDEVKAAIVPNSISNELREAMNGAGINYVEYEAGNEEDRLAKVNQQADEQDLRFQISPDLDAELQEVLDGTFDSENNEVYVGTSSNFLTTVIGAKPFNVLMPAKKAYAAMVTEEEAIDDNRYDENINYHGLGKEGLVNALTSSEEPVAAYVSKDEEGTNGKHRNNRIVLVTDQTDDNGNTIVVVEEVNSRGRVNGKRIDANKTITAYGKNYIEGQIRDAIATDTLLHLDEKRISVLTGGTGFQLPGGREDTYFKNNINNFWANVNYQKNGGKMSTGKTEDDTIARKFAEAQAKKDIRRQLRTEEEERIEELQKKVERLQRDKRRTYGREAKDSDAARVARAILKDTSSDFSLNKTIAGVKKVFAMLKSGNEFSDIYGELQGLARSIADSSYDMVDVPGANDLSNLRQYFLELRKSQGRPMKILIPQNMVGDFDKYGGWKEFRAAHRGIVTLSVNDGQSFDTFVDSVVDELGEHYRLEGDNVGIDSLVSIIEMADSNDAKHPQRKAYKDEDITGEVPENIDLGIMGGWRDTEVNAIIDRLLDDVASEVEPDLTFADRKAAEKEAAVKKAVENERSKWEARREEWVKNRDERIAQMKEDKKLAVEATRAKGEERLRKQAELYHRQRERARERQADNFSRRKSLNHIYKTAQRLSQRLLKPTDTQNVPEKYRKAVAEVLGWLDFENARTDAWARKHGNVPSERILNLRALKDVYAKIESDAELNRYIEPDEQIEEWIDLLSDVEGHRLSTLTTEQLRAVRLVLDAVSWQVNNAGKMLAEGLKENRADMATQIMNELEAQKGEAFSDSVFKKFMKADSTPVHFFERLGSATLKKLFKGLTEAQDKHIRNLAHAQEYIEKNVTDKYGNTARVGNNSKIKKWTEEANKYTLSSGQTIELTGAQVMSLYALNKREQAQKHLLGGGIVIAPAKVKRDLKGGVKDYLLNRQLEKTKARLTIEDITGILNTMDKDQVACAESMLRFLKTTSEWGNETSMKLYGYRKFTEDNYFPIQSAKEYIANSNLELQRDRKIKNQGMTKNVNEYANNPVVIDDFFDVTTAHINQMSQYNSFVPILEDFDRIYQYNEFDEDHVVVRSVKEMIEKKHGRWAAEYIEKLLKNVNGNFGGEVADIQGFDKLLRNWKAAKIGISVRVLAQQPTAVVRAFNEIDPKYFVGTPKRGSHKRMWEICPIAEWKHWGYSQTDIHRSMRDTMLGDKHFSDKLFFDMYGKADDIGWGVIFDAVERETQALMKQGKLSFAYDSDEYRQHVNERFRYIIDRTQVVDSVLHRSQMMRSQDVMMKAATAFMAEPTVSVNTIMTAFTKAQTEFRAGNKKAGVKAATKGLTVFVANAVAVSAMASLVSAIRESYLPDDDDDDEKELTKIQQILIACGIEEGSLLYDWMTGYFVEDFKSNINPLNMIPVSKDIMSMLEGYDAPNTMYSLPENIIKNAKNIEKWIKEDGDTRYSGRYYIERAAESVAEMFGVPAANIRKELIGLSNVYFRAIGEKEYGDFLQDRWELNDEYGSNKNIFIDHYLNAMKSGHKDSAQDIKEKLLQSNVTNDKGEKVFTEEALQKRAWDVYAPNYKDDVIAGNDVGKQEQNLKSVGISQEDIDEKKGKALVSAISEAVENGDTDRIEELYTSLGNYGYGEYDVDKKVKSAATSLMYDAIDAGNYDDADNYIDVVTTATDYTRDDVVDSITTHYMSSYYDAMDAGDTAGTNRVKQILNRYGVSDATIYAKEGEHYKDYFRQKAYMAYASGDSAEAYRIATEYCDRYPGEYSTGVNGMIYGIKNLSDDTIKRYTTSNKYSEWEIPW